jgi:hypothetical protein
MTIVGEIIEKPSRGGWRRVEIDSPVEEALCATNGEDDRVQIVNWQRLYDHGFGALAPIGINEGMSLSAYRPVVYAPRVLGCESE